MWREGGETTKATSFLEREGWRELREDARELTRWRKVEYVRRWPVSASMRNAVVDRAAEVGVVGECRRDMA